MSEKDIAASPKINGADDADKPNHETYIRKSTSRMTSPSWNFYSMGNHSKTEKVIQDIFIFLKRLFTSFYLFAYFIMIKNKPFYRYKAIGKLLSPPIIFFAIFYYTGYVLQILNIQKDEIRSYTTGVAKIAAFVEELLKHIKNTSASTVILSSALVLTIIWIFSYITHFIGGRISLNGRNIRQVAFSYLSYTLGISSVVYGLFVPILQLFPDELTAYLPAGVSLCLAVLIARGAARFANCFRRKWMLLIKVCVVLINITLFEVVIWSPGLDFYIDRREYLAQSEIKSSIAATRRRYQRDERKRLRENNQERIELQNAVLYQIAVEKVDKAYHASFFLVNESEDVIYLNRDSLRIVLFRTDSSFSNREIAVFYKDGVDLDVLEVNWHPLDSPIAVIKPNAEFWMQLKYKVRVEDIESYNAFNNEWIFEISSYISDNLEKNGQIYGRVEVTQTDNTD